MSTDYTADDFENITAIRGIGWQVIPSCNEGYVHDSDGECRKTGNFSADIRRVNEILNDQEVTLGGWINYLSNYIDGNEYHDYTYNVDVVLLPEDLENSKTDEVYIGE